MMEDKILNRIISAAYDDCGFIEKIKIKKLISRDPEAKRSFDSYSAASKAVHAIPREVCPADVINKAAARNKSIKISKSFSVKPAAAFAVILIAAVIGVYQLVDHSRPRFTDAELIRADQQAEQSLALVARILNKTTNTIGQQVLPEKVSKPVKKGLTIINHLFIGG